MGAGSRTTAAVAVAFLLGGDRSGVGDQGMDRQLGSVVANQDLALDRL